MLQLPPVRYILPNLVTLTATFCGVLVLYLSATSATAAGFYLAAALIPIACIIDGFDGRVARLVHGESAFGVQLDSMSDLLTFGVAPAFMAYFFGLGHLGVPGLLVAFAFVSTAMMRLARFNLDADEGHAADRYFEGLPAPMAGMGVAAVVGLQSGMLGRVESAQHATVWFVAYTLLLSFLMVSQVPFRSFKDFRLTPINSLFVGAVLSTVFVVAVVVDPLAGFSLAFFGYLISNLLGAILFGQTRGELFEADREMGLLDEDAAQDETGRFL